MALNLTLHQLEYFQAVARNLSFSQAAEELHTTQPNVSTHVRKLEGLLGVQLFVRSHHEVSLTGAGEQLLEHVDSILQDVRNLEPLMQAFTGLSRGTLAIGATATAGSHILPSIIARFREKNPGIRVILHVGNTVEVLRLLQMNDVEIGVGGQVYERKDYVCEPFYRDPMVVLCRADSALGESATLAELEGRSKVIRERGSSTRRTMEVIFGEADGGGDYVAEVHGTTAINEAVAEGLGITLAPLRSAEPWIRDGSVRAVRIEGVEEHATFNVIYPRASYLTPAARAFIDGLETEGGPT